MDAFNDELNGFKSRIRARAKEKIEEAIKEHEEVCMIACEPVGCLINTHMCTYCTCTEYCSTIGQLSYQWDISPRTQVNKHPSMVMCLIYVNHGQ